MTVRPYKVLLLTCATALFSSPVVSALGSETDDPGSNPVPLRRAGKKKMRAPLLGLALSIHYADI